MVIDVKKIIEENKRLKTKKEKKSNVLKSLSKKVTTKKIIKTNRPTLRIEQKEIPSVLNDPNRFFNQEMEEVKRTLFFK